MKPLGLKTHFAVIEPGFLYFFLKRLDNNDMRRLATLLVTVMVSVSVVLAIGINAVYSLEHKVNLQTFSNASPSLDKGDTLKLSFSMTNTSDFDFREPGVFAYVLVHPALELKKIVGPTSAPVCERLDVQESEVQVNLHPKYAAFGIYVCLITDEKNYVPYWFVQGHKLEYEIHFELKTKLSNGTPYVYGLHYPMNIFRAENPPEQNEAESVFLHAYDIDKLSSKYKTKFVHSSGTTYTIPQQVGNRDGNRSSARSTSNRSGSSSTNPRTDTSVLPLLDSRDLSSNVDQNSAMSDTSEQAEIAQEVRDRFPDRVNTGANGSLSAMFNGDYRFQLLLSASVLLIFLIVGLNYRNRYLKNLKAQKEYQNALKIKRFQFNHADDEMFSEHEVHSQ